MQIVMLDVTIWKGNRSWKIHNLHSSQKGSQTSASKPCETSKQMGPELAGRSIRQVLMQMDEVLPVHSL